MNQNDFDKFAEMWEGAWDAVGRQVKPAAVIFAFESLWDYSLSEITEAIRRHARSPERGRFPPTVADVSGIVDEIRNPRIPHISADEAWAIALESFDEDATVVVTQEILDAKVVAQPVFDSGDSVAARMTFRAAYERLTRSAGPPRWFSSFGSCPARREAAIQSAVSAGLLPRSALQHQALPAPDPSVTVAGLLEGAIKRSECEPEEVLKTLAGMRRLLNGHSDDELQRMRAAKRTAFENHRERELVRLDEFSASRSH